MPEAVCRLRRFHTQHKLLLLAHSPEQYRVLGRIVATARRDNVASLALWYAVQFTAAMQTPPTRGRHVNVLQHIAGYLRGRVPPDGRLELAGAIERYQAGVAGLEEPLRMIAAYARQHDIRYLCEQVYVERYASDAREAQLNAPRGMA